MKRERLSRLDYGEKQKLLITPRLAVQGREKRNDRDDEEELREKGWAGSPARLPGRESTKHAVGTAPSGNLVVDRGSWFFLTLEIVLRGVRGAIKKRKVSHGRQVSGRAFPLYGRGVTTPAPAPAQRADPGTGAGQAGGGTQSAVGERLRPGLAADRSGARLASGSDVTSYFLSPLEKAQSVQRKRDDFQG